MGELGDMDCGSRGLTTQWPLQLSEPQAAPRKIRRLQGQRQPSGGGGGGPARTQHAEADGTGTHTEEKETFPPNALRSSPSPRAFLGLDRRVALLLHRVRVRLGQAPGIREPRFLWAKRAPPAGRATLYGQLGQAGDGQRGQRAGTLVGGKGTPHPWVAKGGRLACLPE